MIKCENGKSTVSGNVIELISDYTGITRHMIEAFKKHGLPDDFIEWLFKEAHELARMTDDELSQKKRELEVQMMMKLFR